jgi:1,4-alpha-glucan branching enzyme
MWAGDYDREGFFWVDCNDHEHSVLSFMRQTPDGATQLIVVLNLTPVSRENYRIGLTRPGYWTEVLNSDSGIYGGSNQGNLGGVNAEGYCVHQQPFSASVMLPPLSAVVFRSPVG